MAGVFKRIYQEVKEIPRGKVASYYQIAKKAKTIPKIVGFALHSNSGSEKVPCHRVIRKDGFLAEGYAFGGWQRQRNLLENEGIEFLSEKRVNPDFFIDGD